MATLHQITHARPARQARRAEPRERNGRPRRAPLRLFANSILTTPVRDQYGSHMPLDTRSHWTWSNPLNLIPATLMIGLAVALVALMFV